MKQYIVQNESPGRHVRIYEFDSLDDAVKYANKKAKNSKSAINVLKKIGEYDKYEGYESVYNTKGYNVGIRYYIGVNN